MSECLSNRKSKPKLVEQDFTGSTEKEDSLDVEGLENFKDETVRQKKTYYFITTLLESIKRIIFFCVCWMWGLKSF